MPDRIQSFKVVCGGGLYASENHLQLAESLPGSATRLLNYEPSLFGGYRRINGYEYYDDLAEEVAPDTAEGPVLGVAIFKDDFAQQTVIIATRKDQGSDTYSFYQHVPLSGWTKLTLPTGITRNMTSVPFNATVTRVRHESFHFGVRNEICFVDGVNPAIVYNGNDWWVIDPTGTGTTADPGGDQAVIAPAVVAVFKNHLFLSACSCSPAVVAHSAPNDALDFTAAGGGGQVASGADVVQIKPFRDNLFVFGVNTIKKVTSDLTAGFLIENVTTNVGCIARDSVLEIGGDLLFLAPDGLRPVAGTSRIGDVELETVSRSIQPIMSRLAENYDLESLTGVVVRNKSQVRYFLSQSTDLPEDAYGIIGGIRATSEGITWEFGELVGIRASCCTSGFVGTEEYVLHGDYDGKVYRQEKGNSFNGRDVLSVFQTPYYDFGDTEVRKLIRKINTFIRAEGPFEMNLSVTYDWDDPFVARPSNYTQASAGAPVRYAGINVNYGGENIVYGGSEKPVLVTSVQGSGFSTQLTYVTVGQEAPFTIQGIVFEFSPTGRR